jgi:hypothetical protein
MQLLLEWSTLTFNTYVVVDAFLYLIKQYRKKLKIIQLNKCTIPTVAYI